MADYNRTGINLKEVKAELRRKYQEMRRAIPLESKEKLDAAICENAQKLAAFRYADTVLLYSPISDNGEINVLPLARAALARGKKVAFPCCNIEDHTMVYRFVASENELSDGAYGIKEPSESAGVFDMNNSASAICFVPAVVFDRDGYRIGYGKGYYDRFLNTFGGNAIGLIYSDFITDDVPRGRFDVSIRTLITEKGVMMTGAK